MGKYEVFLYRPMREKISYRRIHFTKVVDFNDPKPALMALRNCALPEQGVLSHFVIPVALCSTVHLSHFIINLKWMVGGQVTTTTTTMIIILIILLPLIKEIITIDQHEDHFVLQCI